MPTINLPGKTPRRQDEARRRERQGVYQTSQWRKLRRAQLMGYPLCQVCSGAGLTVMAADVHHVRSFMDAEGAERLTLAYDPANLLSLCRECHNAIHNGYMQNCETLAAMISARKNFYNKYRY